MRASINGISLYYEDTGPEPQIPLVFVHGFPFNSATWQPQWDAFQGIHRLVRYDQRGHGRTEVGDGQFPLELFVDDLIGLMDHLKVPKAIFCGLSMGGYVSLRLAERNPDRMAGLILADTKSEADPNPVKISRAESIKTIKNKSLSEFCETFLKSVLASETFTLSPSKVEAIRQIIMGNNPLGVCGTLLALAGRTDTSAALTAIQVPTLILVGEKDNVTPKEFSEKMKAAIPHAELAVIPAAGHLSNFENPEEFNKPLRQFIEKFGS